MSVKVWCDRCKRRIGDVVWLLAAAPANVPDSHRALTGVHHLHWDCIPEWGREPETAEQMAERFHETYERLAPDYGYETRRDSAVPWPEVPDQNRALMVAVCKEILEGRRD